MVSGAKQLKVGLRVADLDRSCALYRSIGFRQIPEDDQPGMRYLTFGHTWLMLSSRFDHGYHDGGRGEATVSGPLGYGVVIAVPTRDLDAMHALWVREGLPITLEPEETGWARIFYGLDPDGYEVMFEQFA